MPAVEPGDVIERHSTVSKRDALAIDTWRMHWALIKAVSASTLRSEKTVPCDFASFTRRRHRPSAKA